MFNAQDIPKCELEDQASVTSNTLRSDENLDTEDASVTEYHICSAYKAKVESVLKDPSLG